MMTDGPYIQYGEGHRSDALDCLFVRRLKLDIPELSIMRPPSSDVPDAVLRLSYRR